MIQKANNKPKLTSGFHSPIKYGAIKAEITLTAKAQRKRIAKVGKLICFQREIGPTPIRKIAGVITGTNTASKNGGPTDSFPSPSASIIRGYRVPSKTLLAATNNNRLLASNNDSRDNISNLPPKPTLGARHANNNNEQLITMTKNAGDRQARCDGGNYTHRGGE